MLRPHARTVGADPAETAGSSSGTGIAYYANEQLELGRESSLQGRGKVTAKDVAEATKAGDPLAVETFARASKYLAMGVVNYLHIFNPSAIIIFLTGPSNRSPVEATPPPKMIALGLKICR